MHVEHKPGESPTLPEPEALAGQELRRLRVARGWSQDEVARRMAAYGYDSWHQTTVGRIEAAQRPLRLNEAVALTSLFGVPLYQLVAPLQTGVDEIDAEIERLEAERAKVAQEAQTTDEARSVAMALYHEAEAVHQERARALEAIDAHLSTLHAIQDALAKPAAEPAPREAAG
jgi:transcriptional regulator with XRE-family HTH domain